MKPRRAITSIMEGFTESVDISYNSPLYSYSLCYVTKFILNPVIETIFTSFCLPMVQFVFESHQHYQIKHNNQ